MTCGTMHCVKICVGMVCQTAHSWVMFSKDLYLVHDTRCQQHSGLEIECIWWKWLGCLITKDAQCRGRLHSPSLRSRQVEHLTRIAHPRYILNTLPFTTAVYVISLQGNRCSQTIITTTKCWLKKHFFFSFQNTAQNERFLAQNRLQHLAAITITVLLMTLPRELRSQDKSNVTASCYHIISSHANNSSYSRASL